MSSNPYKLSIQIVFSKSLRVSKIFIQGFEQSNPIGIHPKHRENCLYEFLCCLSVAYSHAEDKQMKNLAIAALNDFDHNTRWANLTRSPGSKKMLNALSLDSKTGDDRWLSGRVGSMSKTQLSEFQSCAWSVFLRQNDENGQIEVRDSTWLAPNPIDVCIEDDSGARPINSRELSKFIDRLQSVEEKESSTRGAGKRCDAAIIINFENKGYEQIADLIESNSEVQNPPESATLIQYSGVNSGGIVSKLLKLGSRVDLYIVNPVTCTDKEQIQRSHGTTLQSYLDEWTDRKYCDKARNLRIYGYPEEFASLKAVLVNDQLAAMSMYLCNPEYENSKIEGQLSPLTIASAPSSGFTTLSEFIANWATILREPSDDSGYEGAIELFNGSELSGVLKG